MRKFYVFWIVMLAILAIPQKMMAEDVYLLTAETVNGTRGMYEVPSNHQFEFVSGTTYKYEVRNCESDGGKFYFRVGVGDQASNYQLGPSNGQDMGLNINNLGETSDGDQANKVNANAWYVTFDSNTYDYLNVYVDIADDSRRVWVDGHKKTSGGGGETPENNPLDGRTLTEGYYLVGNFFAYDGSTINYDAPVFKFQQKSDDATGKSQYQVEIPATLTAHAQVMSVDALGKIRAIYGPNSIYAINNNAPENNSSVSGSLKANTEAEIKAEYSNYWNMSTRSTIDNMGDFTPGQDGSYQFVLTIGDDGTPSAWSITHNDLKRVAFLIAADSYGTALAVSNMRTAVNDAFNQGKYFGGLYMQSGKQYYFISNEVANNERVNSNHIYLGYTVNRNGIDKPTYNKLFLWGCGGKDYVANNHYISADDGTFMSDIEGYYVLEFNFNNGNNDISAEHGGMTGQVQQHSGKETISSVSMVGSAIPGTVDGTEWNWASTAADMAWDANENCYKLSLVTTADEGEEYFRFVANHKFDLNWHEESTEENDKARKKYQDASLAGHTATADDPNVVCYSDSETRHDADDYHIVWNRPAGNWTVRFYTNTAIENGQPVYTYYYTITENHTLELRDLADVTYKGVARNVLLRGDYKYFRTWSGKKAWKCNKNVDVFIVKSTGTVDAPKFQLVKVNQTANDYTVIPANAGVILAVKGADEDALSSVGQHISAPSATSYNLLRIPMEEAFENIPTVDEDNALRTCVTAQNIPTTREENGKTYSNYLFGFFRATKGDPDNKVLPSYDTNDFLMGFWISNGNGSFYSNSAYLPVEKSVAEKMGLGVSHSDYDQTTGAKKMPAVLFDFADADNTITGIVDLGASESKAHDDNYYTLSGLRVSHPVSGGIYIHHGKKYIVK